MINLVHVKESDKITGLYCNYTIKDVINTTIWSKDKHDLDEFNPNFKFEDDKLTFVNLSAFHNGFYSCNLIFKNTIQQYEAEIGVTSFKLNFK